MKLYAQVDGNGMVVAKSHLSELVEDERLIVMEEREFNRIDVGWRLVDGEWVEPLPVAAGAPSFEEFMAAQSIYALAVAGIDISMEARVSADTVMARAAGVVAPGDLGEWKPGVWLPVGTIVEWLDRRFLVLQGHFSQIGWRPDVTFALFEAVRESYFEWVRPTGVHDAYRVGDRFLFGGRVYEVVVDFMVHSPSEFSEGFRVVE